MKVDRRGKPEPRLRGTLGFLRFFLGAYPSKASIMVALLVLSGLAEGFGIATLLPVLELASGDLSPGSDLGQFVATAVRTVGLSPSLGTLLGLIVVAMTGKAVLLWVAMRTVGFVMADVTADLRLDLFRGLVKARWQYFAGQSKGELANAIGTEIQRASGAFRLACQMFANIALVGVYAAVSFAMSWQATLLAVAAGIVLYFVFNQFVVMSRRAGRRQTELMKSLTSRFVDVVGGLKALKAMALENKVFPILSSEVDRFKEAQQQQVVATEGLKAFREPTLALVLAIGIYTLVTIGEPLPKVLVLAFIGYRLLGIISNVQGTLQGVVVGESAFWSFRELMERVEAHSEEHSGNEAAPALNRGIVLEDAWFSYGDDPVLRGVNLRIPSGSIVSLVGGSGAGKTTIADLILGLLRPDSGRVLADGVPLENVDLIKWRAQIGYVPQEILLLHGTIRHNITLGDDSISDEEVVESLEGAGAWEFVRQRPKGLDSVVGESGAMLSGGQRQRIAISRALVRKPRLLILDEPTTALDPGTEAAILDTLTALAGKVTMLSISHQSALRDVSNEIYLLEDGKLFSI